METVKVWAISVCVAVVIGSVISMITPAIGKQKIMRIVISAFILSAMIFPALSIIEKNDLLEDTLSNIKIQENSDSFYLNDEMLLKLEEASVSALYPILKLELSEVGITEEFGINLKLSQQNEGIEIEEVNISISDLHMIKKDEIQNKLKKKTGLPIEIDIFEGEES